MVTRMVPSPEQPPGLAGQFVKYFHPEVIGSNASRFPEGSFLESCPSEELVEAISSGINVSFSPPVVRRRVSVSDETLEEGPCDALAIGEIGSHGNPSKLGEPVIFLFQI